MKRINGWVNGLLVAAMLASGAALAGPPAQTPSALRGVWFEDSSLGEHHCLQYRLWLFRTGFFRIFLHYGEAV